MQGVNFTDTDKRNSAVDDWSVRDSLTLALAMIRLALQPAID